MKKYRDKITRALKAMSLVIVLSFTVHAADQVFYIDQNLSLISVAGNVAGFPMQEQGAGSLTSHFAGTINVDLAADLIRFSGDSFLDAQVTGDWQPAVGGAAGNAPADYGARINAGLAQVVAALRNIQLDVTSGILPLPNGSFDSGALIFFFPSNAVSTADYRVTGFGSTSGSAPLSGLSTNRVTSLGTLTSAGAVQKLTIPVDAQYGFTVATFAGQINLTGQIVATRTNDVSSGFEISSIGINNQVLTVQWENAPGAVYQIESTTDFNGWSVVASNIVATGVSQAMTTNVTGPFGFFRVVR